MCFVQLSASEVESSVIHSNHNAQTFSFRELATATKNFREDSLLGQGGFGAVYKGRLERTCQVVFLMYDMIFIIT